MIYNQLQKINEINNMRIFSILYTFYNPELDKNLIFEKWFFPQPHYLNF